MKCNYCQKEIAGMRSICPNCQNSLLSTDKETISDSRESLSDSEPRRSSLISIVRIAGLAVVLIGLTTIVRLNYVSGGRPQSSQKKTASGTATVTVSTSPPASVVSVSTKDTTIRTDAAASDSENDAVEQPLRNQVATTKTSLVTSKAEKKSLQLQPVNSTENPGSEIRLNDLKDVSEKKVADNSITRSATSQPEATSETESAPEISLEPPDKSLDQHTGLLTLNSYVRARIYIDGQYSGTTPRTVRLVSGEHTILLLADGYEEWTRKVRLNGRQQTGLMASMNKK